MNDNQISIWKSLQQAHIHAQPQWKQHFKVHCLMLAAAISQKKYLEILVQFIFVLVAIPSSIFKTYPANHPGTLTIESFLNK